MYVERIQLKTIIYIHGYGSDSSSVKAKAILEHIKNERCSVITPDLKEKPSEAIPQIWDILNEAKGDTLLVGSSLGGLYADYFNAMADIPAILINPATNLNLLESLFINDKREFNYIKSRYNDANYTNKRSAPEYVLIAEDDEVIPFKESVEKLEGKSNLRKVFLFEKGGHSFTNHGVLISAIEEMLDVIEGVDFRALNPIEIKLAEKTRMLEKFITATPDDIEMKKELLPVIAPQINAAYGAIGGFLDTPDIMTSEKVLGKLMNNTIWKMVKRNGEIVCGIIYALKRGRKGICLWTNGTPEGKASLKMIMREDEKMQRAWIEVSDKAEKFYSRTIKSTPVPRAEAEIILDSIGKKADKWHSDGYHYDRIIQGVPHTKVIYGSVK